MMVLPGKYKVVLNMGGDADSTQVTVHADPRLSSDSREIKIAQRQMIEKLRKSADKLVEVLDRLSDAGEVLGKINTQLQNIEGKEADSLRKTTQALQDTVKQLREFINGKPSDKQGIARSMAPTVMTRLQEASIYLYSKKDRKSTRLNSSH